MKALIDYNGARHLVLHDQILCSLEVGIIFSKRKNVKCVPFLSVVWEHFLNVVHHIIMLLWCDFFIQVSYFIFSLGYL